MAILRHVVEAGTDPDAECQSKRSDQPAANIALPNSALRQTDARPESLVGRSAITIVSPSPTLAQTEASRQSGSEVGIDSKIEYLRKLCEQATSALISPSAPPGRTDASQGSSIDASAAAVEVGNIDHEMDYLRQNAEHLRHAKHQQEHHISVLNKQVARLQEQVIHHKEANLRGPTNDGGSLEVSSLNQQLTAVQRLKDRLNKENLALHDELGALRQEQSQQAPTCVICMDNLVNLVCLPCRHLALCSLCGKKGVVDSCPICRSPIDSRMQIFMP